MEWTKKLFFLCMVIDFEDLINQIGAVVHKTYISKVPKVTRYGKFVKLCNVHMSSSVFIEY